MFALSPSLLGGIPASLTLRTPASSLALTASCRQGSDALAFASLLRGIPASLYAQDSGQFASLTASCEAAAKCWVLLLDSAVGFEVVEAGAQLLEQAGRGGEVLFDAGDVGMGRVVTDLVLDVDLVDDGGREL